MPKLVSRTVVIPKYIGRFWVFSGPDGETEVGGGPGLSGVVRMFSMGAEFGRLGCGLGSCPLSLL